jgi:putative (di)nucleoside polyphosphate hydrolase
MDTDTLPYRPCAGVLLARSDGMIFAGERLDTIGAWQMPQGGVDPGETPRDAALRELGEETGIAPEKVTIIAETEDWLPYDLPHDLVPKLWKGKYRGQEQKWFLMSFRGTDDDVNIETDHQEFSQWRWLPHKDLIDNIVPFKREVYTAVLQAFASHLD